MGSKAFVFKFADVEVREQEFSVIKAGQELPIEPKAFRVLLVLLRNPRKLLRKEELLDAVWGDTAVTENSLTRSITVLRRLLEDDARNPRFIETVTTAGYRFVCPVEAIEERVEAVADAGEGLNTLVPLPGVESAASGPMRDRTIGFRRYWMPAVLAALIVLGATLWYLSRPSAPLGVASYTQITFDGKRKGVFATDGTRLYLDSDSPNVPSQMAVSGGDRVPLHITVPGRQLGISDISPDGSELLVASWPVDNEVPALWTQSILGGTFRRLVESESGGFSPDGGSIVYVSSDHAEIDIVHLDGTGVRRLARPGPGVQEPRWSPDGRTIRFERDARLWEISSNGTDPHVLLPNWHVPGEQLSGRWSADGRFYSFLVGGLGGQVWAIDERRRLPWQKPAQPVQLTHPPIHWGEPVPGRDGRTIFVTGETTAGELSRFDQKKKMLAPYLGGISAEFVSFSRDGKSVVYVSFPQGILWRANIDGSHRVPLSSPPIYAALPRWSPDGKQIVFVDVKPNDIQYATSYVVSSEGGGSPQKILPDDAVKDADPNWSADGRKIVFAQSYPPDGKEDIRILDMDTHTVTPLAGSSGIYSPRWSPDGRYIAGLARVGPFLRVFDVPAQRWLTLKTTGIVALPCFSADSRAIYFLRYGVDQGIFRIRIPDGKEEKVEDLRDVPLAGVFILSMSLDPTDAPLITRRTGTDDIYALTLER